MSCDIAIPPVPVDLVYSLQFNGSTLKLKCTELSIIKLIFQKGKIMLGELFEIFADSTNTIVQAIISLVDKGYLQLERIDDPKTQTSVVYYEINPDINWVKENNPLNRDEIEAVLP